MKSELFGVQAPRRLLAIFCLVWAAAVAAEPNKPLGERTEVNEAGECSLELAAERVSKAGSGRSSGRALQLECGIGWRTEAAFTVLREGTQGALENGVAAEARTVLRAPAGLAPGWSLAYGVASSKASQGRWHTGDRFVAVEATLAPGGPWLAEASLGWGRDRRDHQDRTQWSLALEGLLFAGTELRAEAAGEDRAKPLLSLRLRVPLWADDAALALAWGQRAGSPRERQASIAIKIDV